MHMLLSHFFLFGGNYMQNLVRLSKAKDLPFATQTYYKWIHTKRYPTLFVKFGSSVFIDLDEQARLMEAGRLGKVQPRPRREEP
jgi:hypothetical protein